MSPDLFGRGGGARDIIPSHPSLSPPESSHANVKTALGKLKIRSALGYYTVITRSWHFKM